MAASNLCAPAIERAKTLKSMSHCATLIIGRHVHGRSKKSENISWHNNQSRNDDLIIQRSGVKDRD